MREIEELYPKIYHEHKQSANTWNDLQTREKKRQRQNEVGNIHNEVREIQNEVGDILIIVCPP